MSGAAVEVEVEGAVGYVTLNVPKKLNSLSEAVRTGLLEAVRDLTKRYPTPRVVVLSGRGKAFSAGADLASGASQVSSGPPTFEALRARGKVWQTLLQEIEASPQPWIAVLHGHCIGGATLLAMACDVRIALPNLKVRIPELPLGIPLTWAGNPRLVREIGTARARDLVMTGRSIDAETAIGWGFATRGVPREEAERLARLGLESRHATQVKEAVAELLSAPSAAVAITKEHFGAMSAATMAHGWADGDLLSYALSLNETRLHTLKYWQQQRKAAKQRRAAKL
eukprot:Hpha_TRINITY_DN21508_c0_g1::TRINITY_DN21508_c0_g1_i1::g.44::m.44/K01715/crt; enoyl-CoA hydratase